MSKTEQKKLYGLYIKSKNSDNIHNVSSTQDIPPSVKIILSLGYKFSFTEEIDLQALKSCLNEGIRKISWKIFFHHHNKDDTMSDTDILFHKIKKVVAPSQLRCPIENVLFSTNFVQNAISKVKDKQSCSSKLHNYLKLELTKFLSTNKVIIKPSDKNAGLCIMNENDYNTEVLRQLEDQFTYNPATKAEFEMKMFDFSDKARHVSNWLFKVKKIKSIIPVTYKPAHFYILPKIHKAFDNFPLGRPISSTVNVINRGVSMLLDKILQPLSLNIPNLLLDSPHLLLLLQNIHLCPEKKYVLITADINSMYLELPINICKQNCIAFYEKFRNSTNFPIDINAVKLKALLDLSLDYSYVEFQNDLYYQKKGIQMGNCASVSVANITAGVELENMWPEEIIFNGRFIDDLIAIADVTNLSCSIEDFLSKIFTHNFLKFTYEYSFEKVNFLDLCITLNDNNLVTSLYQKPMNKHEFVHFNSNHPRHLLKSLPYSCGLRIKRTCSNNVTAENEIRSLMSKFQNRQYPTSLLAKTTERLSRIDRNELLKPKSNLLINFLKMHNPSLLVAYNVTSVNKEVKNDNNHNVYITVPFSNRVKGLGKLIVDVFISDMKKCRSAQLKSCVDDIGIKIAFSVPSSLRRYLS